MKHTIPSLLDLKLQFLLFFNKRGSSLVFNYYFFQESIPNGYLQETIGDINAVQDSKFEFDVKKLKIKTKRGIEWKYKVTIFTDNFGYFIHQMSVLRLTWYLKTATQLTLSCLRLRSQTCPPSQCAFGSSQWSDNWFSCLTPHNLTPTLSWCFYPQLVCSDSWCSIDKRESVLNTPRRVKL